MQKKLEELGIKNLELERKRDKQGGFIKNLAFTPFSKEETAFYREKKVEIMDKAREKEYVVIKEKNKGELEGISKKYEQKISEHEKNLEQIMINLQSEISKKIVQNETMESSINKKEEEKKREDQKNQQKDWMEYLIEENNQKRIKNLEDEKVNQMKKFDEIDEKLSDLDFKNTLTGFLGFSLTVYFHLLLACLFNA